MGKLDRFLGELAKRALFQHCCSSGIEFDINESENSGC